MMLCSFQFNWWDNYLMLIEVERCASVGERMVELELNEGFSS